MPSVTCHLSSAPRGVARITHVHTHVASLRGVRCKLRSITCHVSRWYGTDLTSTAYVVHAENYDTRTPESHVHQAEVRPFTQFIRVATSGALHDVAPGTYPSQLGTVSFCRETLLSWLSIAGKFASTPIPVPAEAFAPRVPKLKLGLEGSGPGATFLSWRESPPTLIASTPAAAAAAAYRLFRGVPLPF